MDLKQLVLAGLHARAGGVPVAAFVEDSGGGQQMMPAAVLLPSEGRMPALVGATAWLNSPPLTLAGLRGKVVLVDFWTYTCINWLRTLP
jgi:hypothetical protein